jgi:hypothetical protein
MRVTRVSARFPRVTRRAGRRRRAARVGHTSRAAIEGDGAVAAQRPDRGDAGLNERLLP